MSRPPLSLIPKANPAGRGSCHAAMQRGLWVLASGCWGGHTIPMVQLLLAPQPQHGTQPLLSWLAGTVPEQGAARQGRGWGPASQNGFS